MRWVLLWVGVLAAAAAAGVTIALASRSQPPASTIEAAPPLTAIATWSTGVRAAPAFRLADQNGKSFSLASLRGHPAIVTFIDPVCRNLCPLEAKVLTAAVRRVPAAERPTIVSISVNPAADTAANFRQDAAHWRLTADWRWGLGGQRQLAAVWQRYGIEVGTLTKFVAGVKVDSVVHTEGSFLVDSSGYERALFLYPFTALDIEQALRRL
jgi:protein SCO1/2